ncbi:DUF2156 domain-containing protein [Desulfoluna spongiiphila]|uniref:Phosphatidylglycerol lysyltransferase C-terminal domain-containing protein n=1 Tax=Desulfoluna spongiiphila TaxID=419481 RepID=A0A1G5DBX6_9BACT|nr:phosphatidylglycerol lysyltransferase domain-containing protein [Desulfoluna spongiiphila]SCY12273.1 hypothetical protein SAMN05216233_104104 [Desulfoluna spongiiphila]
MTKRHDQCGMTPLLPEYHAELAPFFNGQSNPLCGYSLSALIIWKTHVYYPAFAVNGDDAIIARLFPSSPEKDYLILPVPNATAWSPERLAALCRQHGIPRISFVHEAYLDTWGTEAITQLFTLREQTDYEDYVYKKEDLAELKGNKFSKKRNLINQFLREYVEKGRVKVEAITDSNKEECKALLAHWWGQKPAEAQTDEEVLGEKVACTCGLDLIGTLEGLRGILLRVDGTVKAFGMATDLTGEMADFNFEKADPDIKGLYQFFDRQCARMLFPDTPLINKECDMDDPGLRHAKRSYHPHLRFKSHTLELIA